MRTTVPAASSASGEAPTGSTSVGGSRWPCSSLADGRQLFAIEIILAANIIGWTITALFARIPDKLITFYDVGPSSDNLKIADLCSGAKLDHAWNPYYGAYNPPSIPGLSNDKNGAAAIDWQSTSAATAATLATRTDSDGFGVYLTYNLDDVDRSGYANSFTQPLYGQDTVFS